jgi:cytochrome b involved in lipid metabolism
MSDSAAAAASTSSKLYTWEEIMKHTSETDLWVVMEGNVVDVTSFLFEHPGGLDPLMQMGGKDLTNLFTATAAHTGSARAAKAWRSRIIGKLDPTSKRPPPLAKPRRDVAPISYGTDPRIFWVVAIVIIAVVAFLLLN